jgi:uncharacterized membrane protein YjjP (DUF1212 family)
VFYGGGWLEILLALILSFIVQCNRAYAARNHFLSITNEFWNALIASSLATIIINTMGEKTCFAPSVMGALVWDLPGIGIAMALRELATGHSQSGVARLSRSLIVALSMAYGILIGTDLVFWVPWNGNIVEQCVNLYDPFPGYMALLWFPVAICGFFLMIDAEPHHFPGVFFVSLVGFTVSLSLNNLSRFYLHSDIIAVVASFAVGISGRIISRYTKTSSVVYVFAGTLVLLPGGVSVKSIYELMTGGMDSGSSGMGFGIRMMVIAFELAMGSMLSNMIPIKAIGQVKLMQSW